MDRGAAGTSSTSSKYTRSDNDYNRSDDDNAASSRSVQYSHGTVRQSDSPPALPQGVMNFTVLLVLDLLAIYHVVQ